MESLVNVFVADVVTAAPQVAALIEPEAIVDVPLVRLNCGGVG